MNQLQKITHNGIPTEARDAVSFWDHMASQFARGSVASQVMCGFSLIELREQAGIKRGGDRKSGSKPNVFGFDNWADFIEKTYQFTDQTATNRIRMAESVRSDFKKLGLADRFRALLQTHPSQWAESDVKLLSDALAKCTDGMTQGDFLEKLGLIKKTNRGRPPDCTAGGNSTRSDGELDANAIAFADFLADVNLFGEDDDTVMAATDSPKLYSLVNALNILTQRLDKILNARKSQ